MIPDRMIKTAPLERVQDIPDDIDDCTLMYDSFFDDRLVKLMRKFNDCAETEGCVSWME